MLEFEELLARARQEALMGPDAGSPLAKITLELAEKYEIAVRDTLRLEATIHRLTK